MCNYCLKKPRQAISIKKSPAEKETQPTEARINFYEKPYIVLFRYGMAQGYFNIKYCPFCGENLKQIKED